MSEDWSEFTEEGFRRLIALLRDQGYAHARFDAPAPAAPHVLWRHDVDLSMHRAARLAAIEAGMGAAATYFVNPRSDFYSLAEPAVQRLLAAIRAHGHAIGLHFDCAASGITTWTEAALAEAVTRERRLLEMILGAPVTAVSWHNPDQSNLLEFGADSVAGLANAYARRFRRDYAYASDSNGFWRFRPMAEVIREGHPRLHLLTHPGWWTPEPMSPSARVDRCIQGRAAAVRRAYDAQLVRAGRLNLGARGTEEGRC